jgi:cysteine-rich repeat protein
MPRAARRFSARQKDQLEELRMRKSLGIATFFVVGAGAAGAGALDGVQMKGSDTIFEVTKDLLAVCPGATGINYLGSGSGNGETGMKTAGTAPNPQQTVAPMSRFLAPGSTGATCTISSQGGGAWGAPSTAEGLVFAMDGISVVAAKSMGGSTTCNGAVDDCDGTTDPTAGLAFSGTVNGGTYTLNNWRDVLRQVFAGMSNTAGNNIALRDCNSAVRRSLLDNYNTIFQNPASCTFANCAQVKHAFIRDNESGTTDVFVSLLNLTSINLTANVSPFCNALRTSDALPGAAGEVARYFPDYQDFDPVRRNCVAQEQVCHKNGNTLVGTNRIGLGVVIPVTPTDWIATNAEAFPTAACTSGNFVYAPLVPQSVGLPVVRRCPNGDVAAFDSNCQYPRSATNSFKCLNGVLNRPGFVLNNAQVEGREPSLADGRVYNLHLLKDPVAPAVDPTYEQDLRARRMVGAFYRIHTTTSIVTPAVTCQNRDATSQIGCLVSASPCSIGYAGKGAVDDNPGAAALKINKLHPSVDCVQTVAYPLSRKLYLNTFQGFEDPDLATQEFELAKCFANRTLVDPILDARGFVKLPVANPPYCEDFNETQCAGAANNDACANNPAGIPTTRTICGNGALEFGEQCDDGNNVNGDNCNANCQKEN